MSAWFEQDFAQQINVAGYAVEAVGVDDFGG